MATKSIGSTKVKISIRVLKLDKDLEDRDIFEKFKTLMVEYTERHENEDSFEQCYIDSDIYTMIGEKRNTKRSNKLKDISEKRNYFMLKNHITDPNVFKDMVLSLNRVKKDMMAEGVRLRIEVIITPAYNFPLYLRDNQLLPPNTYKDIGYLKEDVLQSIHEMNMAIFDE